MAASNQSDKKSDDRGTADAKSQSPSKGRPLPRTIERRGL